MHFEGRHRCDMFGIPLVDEEGRHPRQERETARLPHSVREIHQKS